MAILKETGHDSILPILQLFYFLSALGLVQAQAYFEDVFALSIGCWGQGQQTGTTLNGPNAQIKLRPRNLNTDCDCV